MHDFPGTRTRRRVLAPLLALGGSITVGCDRIAGDSAGQDVPVAEAAADTAPAIAESPASEPLPERIFFTLTDYDWYARGEPLVHENATYRAERGLIAAPTAAMRKVGEYEGVDVYAADGAANDTALYVPVFPGYWQAFHLTDAAPPAASIN